MADYIEERNESPTIGNVVVWAVVGVVVLALVAWVVGGVAANNGAPGIPNTGTPVEQRL